MAKVMSRVSIGEDPEAGKGPAPKATGEKGGNMSSGEDVKSLNDYAFEEVGFMLTGTREPQVVFRVRERSSVIRYFGQTRLDCCCGLFVEDGCGAVALLFQVGRYMEQVYECWLDYRCPRDRRALQALTSQSILNVVFYGSNGQRERVFLLENSLGDFVARTRRELERLPVWDEMAFAGLRGRVVACHGRGSRLWRALEGRNRRYELAADDCSERAPS
jgi:hypothetical protein